MDWSMHKDTSSRGMRKGDGSWSMDEDTSSVSQQFYSEGKFIRWWVRRFQNIFTSIQPHNRFTSGKLSVCSQSGDLVLSPLVFSCLWVATPDSNLIYCKLNNQVAKLVCVVFRDRMQMMV